MLGLSAYKINLDTPMQEFTVDRDYVRVGIISDSQLPNTREENEYQNSLIRALSAFKARGVDVVLFGGDITDLSKSMAYDLYNAAYDKVFGDDRPIVQTVMGNHDYWVHGVASSCRSIFKKKIGHGPWTHYVVNGYHFIGASPDSGSMDNGYKKIAEWLRGEIDKAVADDAGKPVFVITHNGAMGTTYLEFPAGGDDDFVHSYKPVWSDGSEHLYFSDFYNGLTAMSSNVSLAVDKKAGTYGVKIYAVDSWGAVSAEYIEIDNVSIS